MFAGLAPAVLILSTCLLTSPRIGRSDDATDPQMCRDKGCPTSNACTWPGKSSDIVEWVRSHGGFFHPDLKIDQGTIGRGIFATKEIAAGEEIVSVPYEIIVHEGEDDHPCKTVEILRNELRLGECSKFWPYLRSMQDVVVDIPDAWSMEELQLLDGLPPGDWRINTRQFIVDCGKEAPGLRYNDAIALRALYLYQTRNGPIGMQPIFDIFNHGYKSTTHYGDEKKKQHTFKTLRKHAAGEELFNQFVPGGGNGRHYVRKKLRKDGLHDGAPDTFQGYGFLEPNPNVWWFDSTSIHQRYHFMIEADGEVVWIQDGVDDAALAFEIRAELERLETTAEQYTAGGAHCAAHYLGRIDQANLVLEQSQACGSNLRRQQLALDYRRAFLHAMRTALAAAEAKQGSRE